MKLFGKGRKHRKLADRIGNEIHRQLTKAFSKRPLLFENVREIAFTAGYLKSFTFVAFSEIGCKDLDVHLQQIRYFCNGVLPNRLWDVFQRGEALNELSQSSNREEFIRAREDYELGVKAGINDGGEFIDTDSPPNNFMKFLIQGKIDLP